MAYTFKHGDRPLEGVTVQRAVGRGGFGEVYYALTDSGKQVALKYLRENPEIELRGIAHVMNLKSPYLITIYDVKQSTAGESFVIMEYVGGPSLRELLDAEGNGMPVEKAAFLLSGIAKGLSYLHERGIVHRDLKPANIFYDDGYVKIGDYGLSKHISVSRHSGQTVSVGTVHYMAPEIGSGSYTKAIDIYALGVIFYEMLTGRLPFTGSSMGEVLMRHLRDNPDLTGISLPFARVIAKALAKDPSDRYQSADEMLAAVMDCAEISRSVASFDASALTLVRRSPEAHDPDQTVTSPAGRPHAPPPLDVRDSRLAGLQEAGYGIRPDVESWQERLEGKLDRVTGKIEKKVAKIGQRFGGRRGGEARPAEGRPRVSRVPQMFILLAVTAAISVALSLMNGGSSDEIASRAVALAFLIAGGTVGPLLTHLVFLRRSFTRNTLFDRLAYASIAGLFMAPMIGIATEELQDSNLARLILAPMVVLLLCDWTRRMDAARAGTVNGWSAFWPALVGLITASIATGGDYLWTAAGVCATMSLLTQSAAGMWPLPRHAGGLPPIPDPGSPRPAPVTPGPVYEPNRRIEAAGVAVLRPAETTPITASAASPQPIIVEAATPSFAGRTVNAGLGLFGKLLLLAGLVLALGPHEWRQQTRTSLSVDLTGKSVHPKFITTARDRGPETLLVLAAGGFMLVAARRRDGYVHFFRGCLGCAAMLWGAIVAVAWGTAPMRLLLSGEPLTALNRPDMWGPLAMTALSLAVGVLLLLWPKHDPNRPIVI